MSLHSPKEIAALAVQAGVNKSRAPLANLLILGFLAGAFIATGFLLDIHVIGTLPAEWGSFGALLGAAVFPIGLILTILAGGELLGQPLVGAEPGGLPERLLAPLLSAAT